MTCSTSAALLRKFATLIAFSLCWRSRSGSVSSPWISWNALNGEIAAPMSRKSLTRARRMIGDRSERLRRLRPDGAVIGLVRLREQREALGVLLPREIAAVDDQAADRGAVAADIFRRGIDDDGRAVVERPRDQRRRRVVGNQRHAERAADVGDLADRKDVQLRIGKDLRIIGARLGVGGAAERLRIGGIDEAGLDAELFERLGKQRPGAAIEVSR